MNIVIDAGNTAIKIGVFKGVELVYKKALDNSVLASEIETILRQFPEVKQGILSSVSSLKSENVKVLQKKINLMILDANTAMPFSNLYKTPTTLGVDRLALIAAAVGQYPRQHVLVIDAGTCITYDFKDANECYYGGGIAPGLQLRYKSLHAHTAKLPLLDVTPPTHFIGDSTEQAIHAGVVLGVIYEIEGVIEQYCNTYGDLTVILTGGDAHFLSKRLKNSIFATSNFLLEGLNYILAFNNDQ